MGLSENSLKIWKIRFRVSSDVEFVYVWNKIGHIVGIKFINTNFKWLIHVEHSHK